MRRSLLVLGIMGSVTALLGCDAKETAEPRALAEENASAPAPGRIPVPAAAPAQPARGGSPTGPTETAESEPVESIENDVSVRIAGWSDALELVRSKRGKIVVVNIWTTTCLTCVQEFPHFVALKETYGHDKLALVSVNCDYDGVPGKPPEYYRDEVLRFLKKNQAHFPNVMLNVSLVDFLEEAKLASTPAVYVYRPDGTLAKRFDNDKWRSGVDDFTIEDVRRLIDQLIAGEG